MKVFKSKTWFIGFIFWLPIILIPSYYFYQKELTIWNLGYNYFFLENTLIISIAILFSLFIWITLYRINFFSVKKTWVWFFWWFLWVLISGCPSCSITLASYLWLASFVSVFPYNWIELKVISVIILLYANYDGLKNLEVCNLKKSKIIKS